MKKLAVLIAAGVLTTGCSQLLYPPQYGPAMNPYYRPMRPPAAVVEPLPTGRWDNVMRLPHTSTIDVLTTDGAATVGAIMGADAAEVRLIVNGADVTISRRDVVRIDLVDLAGSETTAVVKETARGAAIGLGVVGIITAVIGGRAWPPPAQLVRAGIAIGGVSGAQAELARRRPRIIYLAPEPIARPPYGDSSDPWRSRTAPITR